MYKFRYRSECPSSTARCIQWVRECIGIYIVFRFLRRRRSIHSISFDIIFNSHLFIVAARVNSNCFAVSLYGSAKKSL